jgi:hypothetical protein
MVVGRKETLVEPFRRRKCRLIAEQNVKILKVWDLAANDDEADGEGCGEEEARKSPQQGPENGGD